MQTSPQSRHPFGLRETVWLTTACAVLVYFTSGVFSAMAIEEAVYTVVESDGAYELRDYAPHIVAEVAVDASMEAAGNQAFRKLFGYISGNNRSKAKLAMTAPVNQQPESEKIAMTAPVNQVRDGNRWVIGFVMPAASTLDTLPAPTDTSITLRLVPGRRMAALRYSGRWTQQGFEKHRDELEAWIKRKELSASGEPLWARYNSPFSLWFLRRNEVLIPVEP